jgi:uncharacterized membrane protein YhhN
MFPPLPWIVFTSVCMLLLILAEGRGWSRLRAVSKTLASTGFLGTALTAGALESPYGWAVLSALFLSWWGDVFLLGRSKGMFLAGLVSFLLGHVAFGAAFVVRGVDPVAALATAGAALLPAVAVWHWLRTHLETGMRTPVRAYVVVISTMVALSVGTTALLGNAWITVGAVMFYLSDLAVARDRFVAPGFTNRVWGLPLYYGAQLILALTV